MHCFSEVTLRIKDGWPLTELSRWIQEDKHEFTDVSRAALVQVLQGYRSAIPAGELIKSRMPKEFVEAKKEIEDGIDEIKELESLYRMQLKRVKIDLATEEGINKLLPSMTSEIKECRQILESISTLKMDLGIQDRAPTKHEMSVEVDEALADDLGQHFTSPGVKKVLENPESRHRVMGTVEKFLQLSTAPLREGEGDGDA